MTWAYMAARGTWSPEFIDDVTADGSIRMKSEVYKAIPCPSTQPSSSMCGWIMTQNILRQEPKIFSRHRNDLFCGQISSLILT